MRRIAVTIISLVLFINITRAQSEVLMVQGVSPDLYIVHKPVPKENYYSVGRLYNVAPKEIAAYNNLVFETGLQLGQPIKIPLTPNNFIQSADAANTGLVVPVYHVVGAKEGLYRISVNSKVPLEQLKKWNHLSSDAVSSGTKLIIGYLKVHDESPLAKSAGSKQTKVAAEPADEQAPLNKTADIPKAIPPVVKNDNEQKNTEAVKSTTAVVKDEPPANTNNTVSVSHTTINFNGGAFRNIYDSQQQLNKQPAAESGTSGVFKSTSGWRDGKYYCFHNNAPAGTIVKITNTVNGKSVYAKVLDLIPDIPQNAGLILHLSNSAADELGITGARFDCSITYSR